MCNQNLVKIFEMGGRKPSILILHFSNVGLGLARQRWIQSQYIRVSIISKVFEEIKLSQKKDLREQLNPHRINQNHSQDLEKLINVVAESKK